MQFTTAYCFSLTILQDDKLLVADAKALQHIFHTSSYRYPKSGDYRHQTWELFGNGLVTVDGMLVELLCLRCHLNTLVLGITHQRQRKMMNPAFSTNQLRTFLSLFQQISTRVSFLDLASDVHSFHFSVR